MVPYLAESEFTVTDIVNGPLTDHFGNTNHLTGFLKLDEVFPAFTNGAVKFFPDGGHIVAVGGSDLDVILDPVGGVTGTETVGIAPLGGKFRQGGPESLPFLAGLL